MIIMVSRTPLHTATKTSEVCILHNKLAHADQRGAVRYISKAVFR